MLVLAIVDRCGFTNSTIEYANISPAEEISNVPDLLIKVAEGKEEVIELPLLALSLIHI